MIDKEEMISCPRCGEDFPKYLAALCRVDNKTLICSDCGTREAFEDWDGDFPPKAYLDNPYWEKDQWF